MTALRIHIPDPFRIFTRNCHLGGCIAYPLQRRASVKNIIESLGVPHTEVGHILADGSPVDFRYVPTGSQRIDVYAPAAPFDVNRPTLLRPLALRAHRFVADVNVGKLAVLMRMIGLDTAYRYDDTDAAIASLAEGQDRIVLSRDTGLLKRRQIVFGRYVRAIHPDDQLKEIREFFGLRGPFEFFSRCLRCNRKLIAVAKKTIDHRLEPKTRKYFHRFKLCPACRQIYWQGSHHEHMADRLRRAGFEM